MLLCVVLVAFLYGHGLTANLTANMGCPDPAGD
jgi:hypothetical protein